MSAGSAKLLLERRISISVSKVPVPAFMEILHESSHSPVSFIDAGGSQDLTMQVTNARLTDVLREVSRQVPAYMVDVVQERVVLRPRRPEYQSVVRGIDLKDVERFEAAGRYASELARQVPFFADLGGPPLLGNPNIPLFKEKVSLDPEATVMQHLAQLLGDDPKVVFLLIKAKSGAPMLALSQVH